MRLTNFTSRVPQIATRLPGAGEEAAVEAAEAIARDAATRTWSQRLSEAIHVEVEDGKAIIVAGNGDVFWGNFEENGTTRAPAHPFLTPAAEAYRRTGDRRAAARLKRLAETGR